MSYRNDFLEAFLFRKKYIPDAAPEKYFSYEDLKSFNAVSTSLAAIHIDFVAFSSNIYLFIWLCWVFIAAQRLSLVAPWHVGSSWTRD